jgi:PAS domain S-box-containing protein
MRELIKALLVEDSEDDTVLLKRELENQNFKVEFTRVDTAEGMVRALSERNWDVVLADYRMPKFSAPAALQLLQESGSDLPFIVVSGTVGEQVAVEMMKVGAHDYFLKDNLTRLGEAIRRELRDVQVRRENRLGAVKIRHLNQVLLAIRNVNQLIIRETDPKKLVYGTCREMVATRGFWSAWIYLNGESPGGEMTAECGFGAGFRPFEQKLLRGELPKCCEMALLGNGVATIVERKDVCTGCPLYVTDGRDRYRETTVLTTVVRNNGRDYGFLCVDTAIEFHGDLEEESLLAEVGGDIAFALGHIQLEEKRKRAEELLRESENKFRSFFELAPEYCFMISKDGVVIDANESAVEAIGCQREELIGSHFASIYADESKDLVKHIFSKWEGHRSFRDKELVIRTRSNEKRTVLLSASAVRNLNGELLHSICVQRDVTERKQMQASLAQSDRLASMGMLAAGVAHEINNPLSFVLYNLDSLKKDLPTLFSTAGEYRKALHQGMIGERLALAEERRNAFSPDVLTDMQERFNDALAGTEKIKEIAYGLRTFSRVEKDEQSPVSLVQVVEVAVSMAFNEIKYRARLTKEYESVPTVIASEGRLSQVFLNLLINAAQAIDEGNVEGNEIRIRIWSEGNEACVELSDTGKGIEPQHFDLLFEPFYTTKEPGTGSGLGLAISRNIIQGYGGQIEVESRVGAGATFIVRLPSATLPKGESKAYRAAEVDEGDENGVKGRILIIDDEPAIRSTIKRMLNKHQVLEAVSGEEGREILRHDQQFDLILCDMMMPNVSGMELHEWLTAAFPELAEQLMFITGGAFTPKAHDYLSKIGKTSGAKTVEKPFDASELRRRVSDMIVSRRSKMGGFNTDKA